MTYLSELGVDLGVENLSSKSCVFGLSNGNFPSSLPNNCLWFFLGPCFPFLLFSITFRGDSPISYFEGWLTLAGVWPQAWLAIRMLKRWKNTVIQDISNQVIIFHDLIDIYLFGWSLKKFKTCRGNSSLSASRCDLSVS